jgi:hypothetical protein
MTCERGHCKHGSNESSFARAICIFFLILSFFLGIFLSQTSNFPYLDVAMDPNQSMPASSPSMRNISMFFSFFAHFLVICG